MIGCFLSGKKPHEVDISLTCRFDLSGRIDVLGISIGQELEHGLGIHCRISAFGGVSLIQEAVVKFLQFVAQQLDRIIILNQTYQI